MQGIASKCMKCLNAKKIEKVNLLLPAQADAVPLAPFLRAFLSTNYKFEMKSAPAKQPAPDKEGEEESPIFKPLSRVNIVSPKRDLVSEHSI